MSFPILELNKTMTVIALSVSALVLFGILILGVKVTWSAYYEFLSKKSQRLMTILISAVILNIFIILYSLIITLFV